MSDHHENQRPLAPRLSADLAYCESRLAGMSLPPSKIDRDTLLYRAGWAAAEAHPGASLADHAPLPASVAGSRRATLGWCLASAALAASLAIISTQGREPSMGGSADDVVEVTQDDETAVETEVVPRTIVAAPVPRQYSPSPRVRWTASLLMMRDRALLQQLDDPWVQLENSFTTAEDGALSRPKSSREMLREFLPTPAAQDTPNIRSTRDRTG